MAECNLVFDAPELAAAIRELAAAIRLANPITPAVEADKSQEPEATKSEAVEVTPAEPPCGIADLSRAGAALIDQGKMPQLLDLLKRYGVQAVTQLKPEDYTAFLAELRAMGAQI